jgi:O-antigen/teichoic acid export membrane protein
LSNQKDYNITKNLVYSGISTVTSFFLFILLIFVGRYLGVEEYGVFTFSLAFVTIFEMFTDFGLRDLSVRNVSRNKELTEKYIGNLLIWKLLLCMTVYLILIITINVLQYDSKIKLIVYIMALSSFLKSFKHTYRLFFQVHNRFDLDTLLVFNERAAQLIVGLLVLVLWKKLIPFVICFVSVRLIDFLITLIVLKWKIAPIKPKLDFKFMKKLQIEALPLGLFFVVLVVLCYIDTVMLSKMRNYHEVGLYNAAFKIYEGITILPTVFFLVILPRLSELFTTDKERHKRLMKNVIKYMFVLALPVLLYGIFASNFFIDKFFGKEFIAATQALQILFLGIAFQFPNWMLHTALISIDKQKIILAVGGCGVVSNIILNLFLIPRYGYVGAAVATVMAEFFMFIYAYWYITKKVAVLQPYALVIKPIMAITSSFLILYVLPGVPVILKLFLSSITYLGSLFLFRTFDKAELNTFKTNILSMCRT